MKNENKKALLNSKRDSIELQVKKRVRITRIQEAVLMSVAAVGLLGVALVAPNALKLLKCFDLESKLLRNKKRAINISRQRLVKSGLLVYAKDGFIRLTPEGEKVLRKIELRNFKMKIPRKWDGRWRIIIFDIREKRKLLRDNLRSKLSLIGFVRLQNSVWVYPYDCEDLINLTKADSCIGREVLYIVADQIENEVALLENFKLKRK